MSSESSAIELFPAARRYTTPAGVINADLLWSEIDYVMNNSSANKHVYEIAQGRLLAKKQAEKVGVRVGLGLAALGHFRGREGASIADSCLVTRPILRLGAWTMGEVTGPTGLLMTNLKAVRVTTDAPTETRIDPLLDQLYEDQQASKTFFPMFPGDNVVPPYQLARRAFHAIDSTMHGIDLRNQK